MNLCQQCGNDFTGVSTFDAHHKGIDPVICIDPRELGFEQNEYGRWGNIGAKVSVARTQTRQDPTKLLQCKSCGDEWRVPRSRGRYPSKCEECK